MACSEWRDEWVAHLYGEVTPEEQRKIEEHLAACGACRETMAQLEQSRQAVAHSALPVPEMPRVVVLRPRRTWSVAWGFATGAVAASLVFLAVLLVRPPDAEMAEHARLLEERVARLEAAPTQEMHGGEASEVLTRAQFDEEMERVSRRHRRERAEDLDYLVRYLNASEQRNGAFMDHTQEALTYLALRGDPRVSER